MNRNLQDRRVQKTRKLLQDALVELISEKGYESLTVQEILDRANVGRSTFYAHFQDKEQLLHSCFESFSALFEAHSQRLLKVAKQSDGTNHANLPLNLFQFVGQNHHFFKALLSQRSNGLFTKIVFDHVFAHAYESLKVLLPREKYGALQAEIVAHYIVSAFVGLLVWWVEKDMPCPADEMERLVRQLAMPGFREVLGVVEPRRQ